jgi:hypothetical protein
MAENGDRRDNEGDRRGRFACARRLLSLGFRPRHAELRPQRGAPAGVGGGDLAQVDDPPPRGATPLIKPSNAPATLGACIGYYAQLRDGVVRQDRAGPRAYAVRHREGVLR